jgi:predicted DNA-binding protein
MAKAPETGVEQVRVNIALAVGLLEQVDRMAEDLGVSRSALIQQAVERMVEDAEDVAVSLARLQDPDDPEVPWEEVKAEAGL